LGLVVPIRLVSSRQFVSSISKSLFIQIICLFRVDWCFTDGIKSSVRKEGFYPPYVVLFQEGQHHRRDVDRNTSIDYYKGMPGHLSDT